MTDSGSRNGYNDSRVEMMNAYPNQSRREFRGIKRYTAIDLYSETWINMVENLENPTKPRDILYTKHVLAWAGDVSGRGKGVLPGTEK